jgi:hypothetical protein
MKKFSYNLVACMLILRPLQVLLRPLLGIMRVLEWVYEKLSFNPEFSIIVTGLAASVLITIVYFSISLALLQSWFDFRVKFSLKKLHGS